MIPHPELKPPPLRQAILKAKKRLRRQRSAETVFAWLLLFQVILPQ
jgi:hypothetical protein